MHATELRARLLRNFRKGFTPHPILSALSLLRKFRVLGYLESTRFLEFLGTQPVADSLYESASAIRASLKQAMAVWDADFEWLRSLDSVPWSKLRMGPRQKLLLFLSKVDYDLEAHLRLHGYASLVKRVDALLVAPDFADAFASYDYFELLGSMKEDSLRSRIWLPKGPAFSHRLKNLLHDAVWVEEMAKAPPMRLSGFLLQGSLALSPSDSALVAGMVRAFGERHRNLAYRIDISKPETWKDWRHAELDRLAAREVRRINRALSRDLRSHLDHEPQADIRVALHGKWHADFFGPLKVYSLFKKVQKEAFASGRDRAREWLSILFPLAEVELLADRFPGQNAAWKRLRKRIASDPRQYNTMLLALGPALWQDFRGTNKALKRLTAGAFRL